MSEILSTDTPARFRSAVQRAADLLRAGEIVALPTETVYGLAANALDAGAVAKIYEAKGRPAHNPIIVHVASLDLAKRCVARWSAVAGKLAKAFWPGPLTLVLPKSEAIPGIVTADGPTVGVRWPSHPFIQAVIRECGFPLAAPSANLSSQVSPTSAAHVAKQLGRRLRLIVDGGPSEIGIESTVLDLTTSPPQVLRPGMIHAETLAAVLGSVAANVSSRSGAERVSPFRRLTSAAAGVAPLRSPGRLKKHYAPRAKLVVLSWRDAADVKSQLSDLKFSPTTAHLLTHTRIPPGEGFAGVSVMPHEAGAFARALYAELHRCDAAGAALIAVEAPPDQPEWSGIADRLTRAAA
jgi:L-threonylcarbamoyladenylate synthase